jgi:hypothetical protein
MDAMRVPTSPVEADPAKIFNDPLFSQYAGKKVLADGERWAAVEYLALGRAQIIVGRVDAYQDGWETSYMYGHRGEAVRALLAWHGEGSTEPDRWLRCFSVGKPTRRRPGADPGREYEGA